MDTGEEYVVSLPELERQQECRTDTNILLKGTGADNL